LCSLATGDCEVVTGRSITCTQGAQQNTPLADTQGLVVPIHTHKH